MEMSSITSMCAIIRLILSSSKASLTASLLFNRETNFASLIVQNPWYASHVTAETVRPRLWHSAFLLP